MAKIPCKKTKKMVISKLVFICLVLSPGFIYVGGLASSKRVAPRKIERVAIIGSGIAGLSLANAFTNSPGLTGNSNSDFKVSLYDSRESLDYELGAGIQLNGALSVLGDMNPKLQEAVIEAGLPASRIYARNRSWFDPTKSSDLWDFSIPDIVKNAGGSTTESLVQNGKILWYCIMRGALQVCMLTLELR